MGKRFDPLNLFKPGSNHEKTTLWKGGRSKRDGPTGHGQKGQAHNCQSPVAMMRSDVADTDANAHSTLLTGSTRPTSPCDPTVLHVLTECLRTRNEQLNERQMKQTASGRKMRKLPMPKGLGVVGCACKLSNYLVRRLFVQSRSIIKDALSTVKSKCRFRENIESMALPSCLINVDESEKYRGIAEVEFWGEGGFHDVWKVKFHSNKSDTQALQMFPEHMPDTVIVRIHKADEMRPTTKIIMRNEVGIRTFIQKHLQVPVPRIYEWDDGVDSDLPYTVEEFVAGIPLYQAWQTYSDVEKVKALKSLAHVLVELARDDFTQIGSLDPVIHGLVSHIEYAMECQGRQLLAPGYWNPGPYNTVREYVNAMYEKEIAFYESGSESIDWSTSHTEYETPALWAQYLRKEKRIVEQDSKQFSVAERFIISHGDLAGRNLLVNETEIVSVLDWEMAAVLPAGQFFRRPDYEVPPLQLYPPPPALPQNATQEDTDSWWKAFFEYQARNEAAMAELKSYMLVEVKQRGWLALDVGHLLRGWGSQAATDVQMIMSPSSDKYHDREQDASLGDAVSSSTVDSAQAANEALPTASMRSAEASIRPNADQAVVAKPLKADQKATIRSDKVLTAAETSTTVSCNSEMPTTSPVDIHSNSIEQTHHVDRSRLSSQRQVFADQNKVKGAGVGPKIWEVRETFIRAATAPVTNPSVKKLSKAQKRRAQRKAAKQDKEQGAGGKTNVKAGQSKASRGKEQCKHPSAHAHRFQCLNPDENLT